MTVAAETRIIGQLVRIQNIIPQDYADCAPDGIISHRNAERTYHEKFLRKVGKVVGQDRDPLHPYSVSFGALGIARFGADEFVLQYDAQV